jgi:hypothetical protein
MMKKGKGEREKEPYFKVGVSSMDADFYRTACPKNLLLIFSIFKNRGFIPCGKSFTLFFLYPQPLALFPSSGKGKETHVFLIPSPFPFLIK